MDLVFCTLVTLDLVQCFSDIVTLLGTDKSVSITDCLIIG